MNSSNHAAPVATRPAGVRFTLFTPTFNRKAGLAETCKSVSQLQSADFEWLIVDDGSTDGTRALVEQWQQQLPFAIVYHWQANQGKHAAHNQALQLAHGEFFLTLDSGDSILPDALTRIAQRWQQIPGEQRPQFAGIAGLCYNEDGSLSGEPYAAEFIDSDYLRIFHQCRMNGERREAIRTEVMREYPYPRIEGERHVRPTLILRRMAHRYKLRFTNEVLQINRHETDGITANRFRYRMRNPKGLRLYYLEELNLHDQFAGWRDLLDSSIRYIRYSLHSGVGLGEQYRQDKHKLLWLITLPAGVFDWLRDRMNSRRRPVA